MFSYSGIIITFLWYVRPLQADSHTQKSETDLVEPKIINSCPEISEFLELVNKSNVIVDKTLFIKDFLDDKGKVILITYPRKWGKSVNMDMIYTFVRMELDKEGNELKENEKPAYQLFKNGKTPTAKPLKLNIQSCTDTIEKHLGKSPAIFLNLDISKDITFTNILNDFQSSLEDAFDSHGYLAHFLHEKISNNTGVETNKDSKIAKEKLDKFLDVYRRKATQADVENSIHFLSQLLLERHGKKPYIFIDNYDRLLDEMISGKITGADRDMVLSFLQNFMTKTFKDNKSFEKGMLSGILRISKKTLFPGMNSLTAHNVFKNKFYKYYGFSDKEVEGLFAAHKIPREKAKAAENRYKGYCVADDIKTPLFNPWSVTNFLYHNGVVDNYWSQSGSFDMFANIFSQETIIQSFFKLLSHESVGVKLRDLDITEREIDVVRDVIANNWNITEDGEEFHSVFKFMFSFGYLTLGDDFVLGTAGSQSKVKIPNKEIFAETSETFANVFIKNHELHSTLIIRSFNFTVREVGEIIMGEEVIEPFRVSLENIVRLCPSFVDVKKVSKSSVHPHEDMFHSLLNILVLLSEPAQKHATELTLWRKETANTKVNRPDISLTINGTVAVYFEITNDQTAKEALQQAESYKIISAHPESIKKVRCFGVNLNKDKTVTVVDSWKSMELDKKK